MASMSPKTPAAKAEGTAQDAIEDVARALERWCTELGVKRPPDYVLAAIQELAMHAGDPEELSTPRAEKRTFATRRLKPSETRRHDLKRPPAGHSYEFGHLMGPTVVFTDPPKRTVLIARSLLLTLGCYFNVKTQNGRWYQLYATIRRALHGARPSSRMHEKSEALERAWEALTGRPFGQPRWRETLENQLEMNARHLEEQRLRQAHGDDDPAPRVRALLSPELNAQIDEAAHSDDIGALFAPATGAQILALIVSRGETPPAELTSTAIDAMIAVVGLHKGGRGGKRTARSVVDDFATELERRKLA